MSTTHAQFMSSGDEVYEPRIIRESWHLNLGLRRLATRLRVSIGELLGLTVISTSARDKILDSAPWLSPYFSLPEKPKRSEEKAVSGLGAHLKFNDPRLEQLRRRYSGHPAADHVQWTPTNVQSNVNLNFFRADNLYVFQSRRYPPALFYATAAYAKEVDALNLLSRLEEDTSFGAEVFDFHGKTCSRDLLDSVIELNFLDRYLGLSNKGSLRVCDIGAGYGRLAHRMLTAFPEISHYYCVDAVPESTYISDYYLKFRRVSDRSVVLPLDELDRLQPGAIDLAINIHSFAECRKSVVDWWLQWLCKLKVPRLFIVSACDLRLTTNEGMGVRKDFRRSLEDFGFRLKAKGKKYEHAPALQADGLYPAEYFLFERL